MESPMLRVAISAPYQEIVAEMPKWGFDIRLVYSHFDQNVSGDDILSIMPEFPDRSSEGDYAMIALKAGISIIPLVGGAAAELIGLVNTPLEKRKVAWLNDIAKRLETLEGTVADFSLNELSESQEFLTIFTHASQIAIRNHEQEKLTALRNAVINTAKKIGVDGSLKITFLSYVDLLSPWHLRVLSFFRNPKGVCIDHGIDPHTYSMGSPATVLEQCFPELSGRRGFYDFVYADLLAKGLVSEGMLHGTMTGGGMTQKRTTDMGDNFLRFIAD